MFRRAPGPMVVAALTGVVSGIWIFKPMLDGSLGVENSLQSVAKQEPLAEQRQDSSSSPGDTNGSTQAAA